MYQLFPLKKKISLETIKKYIFYFNICVEILLNTSTLDNILFNISVQISYFFASLALGRSMFIVNTLLVFQE